ncbi:hypothetical protein BS47DRAFT_1377450 [Hydnum rufescens UP504]|uniref:ubiquitinyl hydrolase 1 n=1 Tax=Hydnum rufescens UP504 TaxID=1448309 RepID=A0A9P6DTD3_9AGAM|nr:hypothetical protein BS47DRAFT_1377450 [Hydnum rufescens UP504]
MMENLCDPRPVSERQLQRSISVMQAGDVVALFIRPQNAGVILRRLESGDILFEGFEASPTAGAVMGAKGKLRCSYPGPAITVPSIVAQDPAFQKELALFLSDLNSNEIQDALATNTKAGSIVIERRDTADPRYITELLTGILRGLGDAADVTRIQKRVADDVLWSSAHLPWRRSALWLVIRVALQTSLYSESRHHADYKSFMVFLMGNITLDGTIHTVPSDLLFCMRTKVSRRLHKLGPTASPLLVRQVREINEKVQAVLQRRWMLVQAKQAASALWAPDQLDVPGDTRLSLHNSRAYLEQTISGTWTTTAEGIFHPHEHLRAIDPRHPVSDYGPTLLVLTEAVKTYSSYVALADLEYWIQENLENWVPTDVLSDCNVISACIAAYYASANRIYNSNPEDQSTMFLTLFELWVALDKLAVANCPLLLDYSPEVAPMLLEPLLLRRSRSFDRVARIRQYLRERHGRVISGSIFTDTVDLETFAVRYFDGSPELSKLKADIEADAKRTREEKRKELQSKNAFYRELEALADPLEHCYVITPRGYCEHDDDCLKCSYENEAESLDIVVHEWPLPRRDFRAKAVIFELRSPPVFQVWRTTTYELLRDICTPPNVQVETPDRPLTLREYFGPRSHVTSGSIRKISLASGEKSFERSHYNVVKIPSSEEFVLLNNGPSFRLYDEENKHWAADLFGNCNVSSRCTMQLPPGPYSSLQYAVTSTSHTSNEVLAKQSECPADISLHEYAAFGGIRAGPRLQWLNISREIAAQTLSLHREEVHILLAQAAWQIGPLSDKGNWDHHEELSSPDFGMTLLHVLGKLINDIEANWFERASAKTAIALIGRLLASATDQNVIDQAYIILRKTRHVALRWLDQLGKKLEENEDESAVEALQMRVLEVAAICRGTYDVDPLHAPFFLESAEDVSVFVRCAIVIHQNSPANMVDASPDLKRLCARDRRLAYSMEPLLSRRIRENRGGLDTAIGDAWKSYRPGPGWEQFDKPNDRWWSTTTSAGIGQMSQDIHFNFLDGQLLVSGKPLGRLPRTISQDPIYRRVLGKKILHIIPSDMPNMEYATPNLIFGCHLLPHHIFTGDLPTSLTDHFVHWINISSREVELRPLSSPWLSLEKNWRIYLPENGPWTMMDSSSRLLVDARSRTFGMITRNNLVVTYNAALELCVELPRFRLSFVLRNGHLHCCNFPGMVVDKDRILVLRSETQFARSRRVIIPQGEVKFSPSDNHVSVTIDTADPNPILYQDYEIDTNLGCLVGNGTMMSHYFRAYLHAVTSHCLPDPLTLITGTEEALNILRSASCRSFQRLDAAEVEVLREITALTPVRTWYPSHCRVMQQVQWSQLAPSAQHDGFRIVVKSIIDHAEQLRMFYDSQDDLTVKCTSDIHLLARAARRSAFLYSPEFAGDTNSHYQDNVDVVYVSRDLPKTQGIGNEAIAQKFSKLLYLQPSQMEVTDQILEVAKSWGELTAEDPSLGLRPSQFWGKRKLGTIWLPLYNICRRGPLTDIRFQLVFSLSSLAYTSPDTRPLIPTILAFAVFPEFRSIAPPLRQNYDLSQGWEPQPERLKCVILASARRVMPFDESPEAELPPYAGERLHLLARRRLSRYNGRLNNDTPNNLIEEVRTLFTIWYSNLELRNHLAEVQNVLNGRRSSPEGSAALPPYMFTPCSHRLASSSTPITYDYLFSRAAPSLRPPPDPLTLQASSSPLNELVSKFQYSPSNPFRRRYGEKLAASVRSLISDGESARSPHQQPYSQEASLSPSASDGDQRDMVLCTAGLWPSIAIRALLRQLSSSSLTGEWKGVLVSLAEALLRFQQAQRLLSYCLLGRKDEFTKEAVNFVRNRDTSHCLDWLLIQVEGNFLARSVQIDIAEKMIAPPSGENSVLQLNMGEGKSSVIVPMTAASLADGRKLVRVVVPKPLLNQMFRLLVHRLGGLANRPIFYAPFSRAVQLGDKEPHIIQSIYDDCMRVRGVLVVQPEHLLSFKLMGINQRLSTSTVDSVGDALLRTQKWLERNSRDILDESDEVLHVKYQLVYTLGQPQRLEHHPHRWAIIQDVFACVQEHGQEMKVNFPSGVDIQEERGPGCGSFTRIRILQPDAGRSLAKIVADDAMYGRLPHCPQFRLFEEDSRRAARDFITQLHPLATDVSLLRTSCDENLWKSVLLLRGLLAHGILNYVLRERRWRVDYGLDASRSLLAVPYRAKDVPAVRAEFGHPDVCIALTALSYYYGGLSESQLDTCFNLLAELDNPDEEYEKWIRNNDRVPDSLRARAESTHDYLQPAFLNNRAVINFFLSSVVFPKEGKEFRHKLATSGWDIAERKDHVTTGLQQSTNARVLAYVLQPENDFYQTSTSTEGLLKLIMSDPDIHVLLDVGAQMLDVSNSALAERWLSSRPRSFAAIYFGDDDNLVVRTRDGNIEPFISSPFSKRLHESEPECLVYLDDTHTRGTDLKLPERYCAAVTLGPKVTKDRLVQGCMRMRLLGHGQSVDQAIRQAFGMSDSDRISVSDILQWAMLESCSEIQHFLPHWREQGIQYASRRQAWLAFSSSNDRSRPHHPDADFSEIDKRYEELAISGMHSEVRMEEEQEREVDHEVERERQVERPAKAEPMQHHTGIIRRNSASFIALHSPLAHIKPGIQRVWSSKLFSTIDFAITILNWIVSNLQQDLVILSPFEVNHFLPEIRQSKVTHLHIYAPRTTQSMISFDDFKFHCIPPLPRQWIPPPSLVISQLNLWAGQLYLRDHRTYMELCRFLGIVTPEDGSAHRAVQTDGFVFPEHRGVGTAMQTSCSFTESPIPFIARVVGLRRKGMSYLSSHIGKLVNASLVEEEDFSEV